MRPVRIIAINAVTLLRASLALTAAAVALLLAATMVQPIQAAANPSADDAPPVTPDHQPPWLVLPGEQLTLIYGFENWYGPLSPGVVYLRNDTQRGFTRLPLSQGSQYGSPDLVARVPGRLVRGHQLLYYAILRNPATGKTITVPAGGAGSPQRVWVLDRPLAVPLGTHTFGHLRSPDAIVARAGPNDVGFSFPPSGQEGVPFGPWSFDVARDGSIWLLDQVKHRLLVWQPGQPDRPARTVRLPQDPLERIADFAVAPDHTIYATYLPPPGPGSKTLRLCALTPTGQVRWTAPTTDEVFNAQLRIGPDGTLYVYGGQERGRFWTPLTTPAGQPVPVAEQRRRASRYEPLPDGLRLLDTGLSAHEQRLALIDQAGQVIRAWRVTSQTDLGATTGTPALVGGDPVVVLEVTQPPAAKHRYEYLVLRLAPAGGTRVRFALAPDLFAVFGDLPITGVRVGPDGRLYRLRSNPTTGVSIARYSLDPAPPPASPAPVAPVVTAPPVTRPPVPAPAVTLPPSQPTTPAAAKPVHWWIIPGLVALASGALAALGVWLWYRRRHPASPTRQGRSRMAH
jgi:hypothetical protein